jgi:hypothetical protein
MSSQSAGPTDFFHLPIVRKVKSEMTSLRVYFFNIA